MGFAYARSILQIMQKQSALEFDVYLVYKKF